MTILLELFSLWRFLCKTPQQDKKIIFYAEHEGYYPNFEGIIEELTKTHKKAICYVTSDSNDPVLKTKNALIHSFYIKRSLAFFFAFVNCSVFVMTMPELDRYHLKRSINDVFYVYVFHSICSIHTYSSRSFDSYNSFLCAGPHHLEELQRYGALFQLPPKQLVKAGYPRLERIYDKYITLPAPLLSPSSKTILIAPTWGENTILEYCGAQLIRTLLKNNYCVILRPHPEVLQRDPRLIFALLKEFGSDPKFTLERSVSTDDSLLTADILISDFSGIIFEYAFGTQRPVLFLDVPFKPRNKNYQELGGLPLEFTIREEIGIILSTEKMDEICPAIEKLLNHQKEYKERIMNLRERYIYNLGRASAIGAQHIIDQVKSGPIANSFS